MARYHLSPKFNGEPRVCSAKQKCDYADANDGQGIEHYDNKAEAMKAYEKNMAEENPTIPPKVKKNNQVESQCTDQSPTQDPTSQPPTIDNIKEKISSIGDKIYAEYQETLKMLDMNVINENIIKAKKDKSIPLDTINKMQQAQSFQYLRNQLFDAQLNARIPTTKPLDLKDSVQEEELIIENNHIRNLYTASVYQESDGYIYAHFKQVEGKEVNPETGKEEYYCKRFGGKEYVQQGKDNNGRYHYYAVIPPEDMITPENIRKLL